MLLLIFHTGADGTRPFIRFGLTSADLDGEESGFRHDNVADGEVVQEVHRYELPEHCSVYVSILLRTLITTTVHDINTLTNLQILCLIAMKGELAGDQMYSMIEGLEQPMLDIANIWWEHHPEEWLTLFHELRQFGQTHGL